MGIGPNSSAEGQRGRSLSKDGQFSFCPLGLLGIPRPGPGESRESPTYVLYNEHGTMPSVMSSPCKPNVLF
jgi:hypothetical protein